ncbi:MAG: tetratricopeptide repeat protein, partial [Thermoguttaceae bacterium]
VLQAVNGEGGADAVDPSLAKVLMGRPGSTYQLMGECFLEANRPKEAKTVFEKAEKVTPDKALHQFNLARVYAKLDKPAEALASLEASFAEKLTDQGESPYETLADVLKQLGQSEQLVSRLEKLRAANPKDAALGYYLASRYQKAGQFDRAERLCLELVRAKPSLAGYRRLMEIDRQAKRYDALLAVLGEALDKNSALEILGAESQLLSNDAESMREIVQVARQRLKSSPDEFGYGKRLAVALLSLEAKQYETAAEFFDLAMKAKDWPKEPENKLAAPSRKAELLMAWGVGLLLGDHAAEAARVFQRAVDEKALPSDNPSFYFYLAGALAMSDRVDEALAAARTAAEKKPDSARMRGREAWVLYVGKRYEPAKKAYEKLLEAFDADHVSPETRQVLREARLSLSNLAVLAGDLPKAEEWLEQVLDEFPDDVGAMNDLGYLWADQNRRLGRAERMIRKAVDAEPDNAAYRDSLGWALYRQGRLPEAVVELEKATAGSKPDGVVLDHLGDAYQKMNRRDRAVATWRKAADAFRRDKEPEKAATVEKKIFNR